LEVTAPPPRIELAAERAADPVPVIRPPPRMLETPVFAGSCDPVLAIDPPPRIVLEPVTAFVVELVIEPPPRMPVAC
jgi:hypothetical protein